jgi:GAF domain
MTAALMGFILLAIVVPLLVSEAGDLAPFLARQLLGWGARRIGDADQARRYAEEWLADLERVPGKVTKLAHACGVLALSVPRLRAQVRRGSRRARLPRWIRSRAAEQLARAAQTDAMLQRVAETLVPHFADHCFIDLFQGDALIRRVQRHAGGWTPPPGTWAQTGEQIRYPEEHFCQLAMARLDTVLTTDLTKAEESVHAPSSQSLAAAEQAGLKSSLAAPLYARGILLGVISLATSELTGRTKHFDTSDREIISAVASRLSAAIDTPPTSGSAQGARTWAGLQPQPIHRWPGLGASGKIEADSTAVSYPPAGC